jgi:glycosyltransferase involved in cell wall biosynthesis
VTLDENLTIIQSPINHQILNHQINNLHVHTEGPGVKVVQINYAYDADLADPDALLDRYTTLTGWSEALVEAGARGVTVFQRFTVNAQRTRHGIDYIFHRDGGPACAEWWTRPRLLHRHAAAVAPDIAHVNGLIFPVQTWLLRRTLPANAAIVLQDHAGGVPKAAGPLGGVISRLRTRAMSAADGFLFSADEQAEVWREAGIIDSGKPVCQVMEASTTIRSLPRPAARETSGVTGCPALLWVGRLNANKDPLTVLDGFERALPRLPEATLTMIYGSDELLPAVRDRIGVSSALTARVRLVGPVPRDRLAWFYSAADRFVLGSHHEGSGYALLEALACGVVPVVTDIPSFRAMTANGSFGALWPPGDAGALADALVSLDRGTTQGTLARIKDHFARELSWRAIGRQAVEAYLHIHRARSLKAPSP